MNEIDHIESLIDYCEEWHSAHLTAIVTDPGSGQKISVGDFERKYSNPDWTKTVIDAVDHKGFVDPETFKAIKAKHNDLEGAADVVKAPKSSPEPVPATQPEAPPAEPKQNKSGKPKDEHPFVKVHHLFVDKLQSSDCHKNPTATMLYLLKHKGFEGKGDKHNTGSNWYLKKKLIVASVGQARMMRELGIDKSTVKRHLQKLKDNGDITSCKENRENVYILGYVDDGGVEHYYHDNPNAPK